MKGLRELFALRPDVTFLNQGSFGACPRAVIKAYQKWQIELEREPVEFLQRRLRDLLDEARQALATFIGADADDLVYVTNVTTAYNILARSLPLESGDEVLSTDLEYGAMDNIWRFICDKRGARLVQRKVPLPAQSRDEIVEAIWSGVTERTRVLSISHITSGTALILPVEELVRRAREADIIAIVDGAHAVNQIPLDMKALGADFYAGSCHKWLMGPKGSGFLYARREMQHLLEPLVVSFAFNPERAQRSRFLVEQQYQGTRDPSAFLAVPAAIRFREEHDWPSVQRECHELVRYARHRIGELTGLQPLTPDSTLWFVQMGVIPIPACDGQMLHRRLYEEYRIEVPVTTWNEQDFVRVSVQGYNTKKDMDALVEALDTLL